MRREELGEGRVHDFGRRDMAVLGEPDNLLGETRGIEQFLLGLRDNRRVQTPAKHQQRTRGDLGGEGQRVFGSQQGAEAGPVNVLERGGLAPPDHGVSRRQRL